MLALHVTEILAPWTDFGMVPEDILRAAAERGKQVHSHCACYAATGFVGELTSECRGYVMSFVRWFDEYVDRALMVEERLSSETYGFTGAVDLVAEMKDGAVVLVDLKTPAVGSRIWRAQIAAYGLLLRTECALQVDRIMALRLKKDGKPAAADVYDDTQAALSAFLSALNCKRYFLKGGE